MKRLLFILMIPLACQAQKDPCDRVTKKYDEMKNITTYSSPSITGLTYHDLVVRRHIMPEDSADVTVIDVRIPGYSGNYSAKGIYIKFEDGTIYKEERADVECDYSYSKYGPSYMYSGMIALNDENIDLFKTKKIVKIQLSHVKKDIKDKVATYFQGYVNCVLAGTARDSKTQ